MSLEDVGGLRKVWGAPLAGIVNMGGRLPCGDG